MVGLFYSICAGYILVEGCRWVWNLLGIDEWRLERHAVKLRAARALREDKAPPGVTAPDPAFERDWEERAKPPRAPKATVMRGPRGIVGVYGYDEDENRPGWQPL